MFKRLRKFIFEKVSWRTVQRVRKRERRDQAAAPCTIDQYVEFLGDVPMPTPDQRREYARFVAHSHSWYKHLPFLPPCVPFVFFINKNAGCNGFLAEDGSIEWVEQREQGIHYASIPTASYRSMFGHLTYRCDAGSSVMSTVIDLGGEVCGLPREVANAGMVKLSGVIHTLSGEMRRIPFDLNDCDVDSVDSWEWPEASGGQAAKEKLRARERELQGREGRAKREVFTEERPDDWESQSWASRAIIMHTRCVDRQINEILLPERERQYAEIVRAMDRVCDLVESHRRRRNIESA